MFCRRSSIHHSYSLCHLLTFCASTASTPRPANYQRRHCSWSSSEPTTPTTSLMEATPRTTSTTIRTAPISYLGAQQAASIDVELMDPEKYAYSIDQLMELAGLSVACAVRDHVITHKNCAEKEVNDQERKLLAEKNILVVCGPGNNGGDGMVAARHLKLFGFEKVTILCLDLSRAKPRPSTALYKRLLIQAAHCGIDIIHALPAPLPLQTVVVDAIFGFSFKGPARDPFQGWINTITEATTTTATTTSSSPNTAPAIVEDVIAVDIPSGWHVDDGPVPNEPSIPPTAIVSLTLPKNGVKDFKGAHYVGGRFVPEAMVKEHGLVLPVYKGSEQIVRIDA